jgi:hypothetical protein
MARTVYYLTGMNGHLAKGLGEALLRRDVDVSGRELVGDFRSLGFQEQIDTVCDDLTNHFWSKESHVIANSFGAYLFLQAQSKMKSYIGKVTLLSPIVGEFGTGEGLMNFIPPRSGGLYEMVLAGTYPAPKYCDVHVGSEDWQSNPTNVTAFCSLLGIDVNIVPNAGHMLPKDYVGALLDRWL